MLSKLPYSPNLHSRPLSAGYITMSIQSLSAEDLNKPVDLRTLTMEELLRVWEQSQRLSLMLQQSFLPGLQLHSATEDMIIAELLRRETVRRQGGSPSAAALVRDMPLQAPKLS